MKKLIITFAVILINVSMLLAQTQGGYKHIQFVTGTLKQIDPVKFKTGTAEILPESEPTLMEIKSFLEVQSFISTMRIEGHTANKGKEDANLNLSKQRAMAVAKWLSKNGIDCNRLLAVGFGSSKPAYDNGTPEGAQNNRIEFVSAAIKGNLIGGETADGGGSSAGDVCK